MPQEFNEGDLVFAFDDGLAVRKFDGPDHGMSHFLKAVDFVVESDTEITLIEVKDPGSPDIPDRHRAAQDARNLEKVRTGELFNAELAPKLKDSLFYLYLRRQLPDKDLRYLILLSFGRLDVALLMNAQDRLRRACACPENPEMWQRRYAVALLTLEEWNRRFPGMPVSRPN